MVFGTITTPPRLTEGRIASEGLRGGYGPVNRTVPVGLGLGQMKLHQLRYLAAVAQERAQHHGGGAQAAYLAAGREQADQAPRGRAWGFQIFVREGRNLTRITPAGQQVIDRALRILQEAQSIRHLSTELRDEGKGSLSIGTTHTQARYVLPDVIREFRARYPQVRLNLHQGTSEQIAEMVASDRIDCAIATGSEALFSDLTLLPCYRWLSHGHRAEGPSARQRRTAELQGAGRVPADHVYVQLHRALVPA